MSHADIYCVLLMYSWGFASMTMPTVMTARYVTFVFILQVCMLVPIISSFFSYCRMFDVL